MGLVLTFLPFVWKAGTYALIGSYVPLFVLLFLGAIAAAGLALGRSWAKWGVRIWCAAMIGWGVMRLLLLVLVIATKRISAAS